MQDLGLRSIKIGKWEDGLYKFTAALKQPSVSSKTGFQANTCSDKNSVLWHARLGHVPFAVMKHMSLETKFADIPTV